jgi:hypothetical protein
VTHREWDLRLRRRTRRSCGNRGCRGVERGKGQCGRTREANRHTSQRCQLHRCPSNACD